jgi:hypothetical protein
MEQAMRLGQLDQGFTHEGFAAHVLVEAVAAFAATLGALIVAWLIYRWTSAFDRKMFQDTVQHNIDLLAAEAAERRKEREASELAGFHQSLRRIAREVAYNRALARQKGYGAGLIPFHTEAMREIFSLSRPIPGDLDYILHRTLYAVERSNWAEANQTKSNPIRALKDAYEGLIEAEEHVTRYLKFEGIDWTPITPPPTDAAEEPDQDSIDET